MQIYLGLSVSGCLLNGRLVEKQPGFCHAYRHNANSARSRKFSGQTFQRVPNFDDAPLTRLPLSVAVNAEQIAGVEIECHAQSIGESRRSRKSYPARVGPLFPHSHCDAVRPEQPRENW